jgi:hypothetical protein
VGFKDSAVQRIGVPVSGISFRPRGVSYKVVLTFNPERLNPEPLNLPIRKEVIEKRIV